MQPPRSIDDATHEESALQALMLEAGAEALRYFRLQAAGPPAAETKADGSLVTEADRAVERLLVKGLRQLFPDDGIHGEEGTRHEAGAHRWFVDPIDGTGAFVEGLATWGPTVARYRVRDQRVVLAAFHMPRIQEYFSFARDRATVDGIPLTTPPTLRSPERVLYIPSQLHRGFRIAWGGKVRSLGSTAAHLCLTARGSAQAALIGPGWKPWDVACGLAMLEATGCQTATFRGGAWGGPLSLEEDTGLAFVAGLPEAVRWLTTPGTIHPTGRSDRA